MTTVVLSMRYVFRLAPGEYGHGAKAIEQGSEEAVARRAVIAKWRGLRRGAVEEFDALDTALVQPEQAVGARQSCDDRDVSPVEVELDHRRLPPWAPRYAPGTVRNFVCGEGKNVMTVRDSASFRWTGFNEANRRVPWLSDYWLESRAEAGRGICTEELQCSRAMIVK